ncbi:Rsm22-cox11 tandem protein 2, mitochondrial [Leucoagaricus sp. SymC.cos]|nr:Rsm22-cox11 tandem protein 2, mitochondrial [Leucoagaricus sp. SymC.cos]
MALHSHSKNQSKNQHELEIVSAQDEEMAFISEDLSKDIHYEVPRKSPAALFGSQRAGSIILPLELQDTIRRLICDANKPQIHSDAKRLFQKDTAQGNEWDLQYDTKYRTRIQGVKHAKRDGTAFASIALPAHYSAIFAVLDHVKRRLGPSWRVERVLDWGAGAVTLLPRASLYSFQTPETVDNPTDTLRIADSALKSYTGIEKRNGLTGIGRRLMQDIRPEHLSVSWQKGWRPEDNILPSFGDEVVALSAFLLSTLPDALARKTLVQEIWDSGASTMILIDHSSKAGFEAVAAAREYLLNLGRKELTSGEVTSASGSHVLAPCPHDGACPLFFPGAVKLVCGYSQRIQRPEFVRRTKHSNVGHEDIGYSYVVIQRGERPRPTITGLGRTGAVGQRELDKAASELSVKELHIHDEQEPESSFPQDSENKSTLPMQPDKDFSEGEIQEAIRLEAYQWPRLIFPPLKKSGHIILDGCTAEGKIMRMTIPRSQGKQPFYDARKSGWGDIFPHPPKNKPQERQHVLKPGSLNVPGSDIGKRGPDRTHSRTSYEEIAKILREDRKKAERMKRRARVSSEDSDD